MGHQNFYSSDNIIKAIKLRMMIQEEQVARMEIKNAYKILDAKISRSVFFLICAVGPWVLRPLLAYCTSPG
jgi:hypothetical protein